MRTAVLNTGTELLLGNTINTHLAYIARAIFPLGLRVSEQLTVPDGEAIASALLDLFPTNELIFVTGGLGPTSDDITREITAELLGLPLVRNEEVMNAIQARASLRGFQLPERFSRQAMVPEGAVVLHNANGSAPGLYLPRDLSRTGKSPHLFLLPGPPRELYPMFEEHALPLLRQIVLVPSSERCRVYSLAGIGESAVEEAVGDQLLSLPLEVGYCARPGEVEVRLIGEAAALQEADQLMRGKLGQHIFTTEGEPLEEVVVRMLAARGETLAVAESCTGGALAHRITNVPGASTVFRAGYVPYANESKADLLGVPREIIEQHGAVSEAVAVAMAEGARARSGSNHALSTTGIAGPAGGSEQKPVGTIFLALASSDEKTMSLRFNFASDRETFKQLATQAALNLLRRRLLKLG